jgi:hypothetical protein
MKKSNKSIKKQIQLPAHLQILADRWNENLKNNSYTITDVTPAGYGN